MNLGGNNGTLFAVTVVRYVGLGKGPNPICLRWSPGPQPVGCSRNRVLANRQLKANAARPFTCAAV